MADFSSASQFMPHIHCYLNRPSLVWTMFTTDLVIGLAYFGISLTLWHLIRRIQLPFSTVVLCFGVFISACGLTHFMEDWTLWYPDYWLAAAVKGITAIASIGTGIYLIRLRHPIVAVAETTKLSEQRRLDLERLTKDLELRVAERTQALQESSERFRTFTEAMPQMTFASDAEGNITYYNQRYCEYVGNEIRAGAWRWQKHPFIHPDDLSLVLDLWNRSLATGEFFEVEHRLRRYDGQYRWHLGRAVPLHDSGGKVIQWLGTNTDIHEGKLASEELKKTADRLEAAVHARDEFLSIASHELKTPLASLKLHTQLFRTGIKKGNRDFYSPQRIEKLLEHTDRQINRLNRLVDDMLDIARIRSGKLTIHRELLSLSQLVNEVVSRLEPIMKQAGTPVDYSCDEEIEGHFDRFRVEQVVTNLLTNAMRYGEKRPVTVRLKRNGKKAVLAIQDLGCGIEESVQKRIFDRFERAISANEVSGLGLGLFITRQIVEAHQGDIRVESKGLGHGSTFYVEFPINSPKL